MVSTYAKLIAYSHRLKCLSNGHSRLNKCAINFARLLISFQVFKIVTRNPQNVSDAIASDEVVDIFTAAGMKNPDTSILSEEFFADVCQLPQLHLALELLRKLIKDDK